jgi:hypothetical protein
MHKSDQKGLAMQGPSTHAIRQGRANAGTANGLTVRAYHLAEMAQYF